MAPSIHKSAALLLVTAILVSLTSAKPTDFSQCNPQWKDKRLGNKADWPTICEAGD